MVGAPDEAEQVVVVDPHDQDGEEAEPVGQVDRPLVLVQESVDEAVREPVTPGRKILMGVGHMQIEREQRYGDGEDTVAERLQSRRVGRPLQRLAPPAMLPPARFVAPNSSVPERLRRQPACAMTDEGCGLRVSLCQGPA